MTAKYADKNGNPTYKVAPDGTVDFYTYAGFIRYSANCLQCHGPDGMGSDIRTLAAPFTADAVLYRLPGNCRRRQEGRERRADAGDAGTWH